MKVEKERTLELENAVVDGIDISGKWNRMYLERVITDYSFDMKLANHEPSAEVTDRKKPRIAPTILETRDSSTHGTM